MKIKIVGFLFLASSLLMVSCKGDTCDDLSETVVGSWSVDGRPDGTVTMNTDGTLVDTDNVIFPDSLNGTTKTYELNISQDTLILNADNGLQTSFVTFAVSSFECDEIVTTNEDNTFTFKRN